METLLNHPTLDNLEAARVAANGQEAANEASLGREVFAAVGALKSAARNAF